MFRYSILRVVEVEAVRNTEEMWNDRVIVELGNSEDMP